MLRWNLECANELLMEWGIALDDVLICWDYNTNNDPRTTTYLPGKDCGGTFVIGGS